MADPCCAPSGRRRGIICPGGGLLDKTELSAHRTGLTSTQAKALWAETRSRGLQRVTQVWCMIPRCATCKAFVFPRTGVCRKEESGRGPDGDRNGAFFDVHKCLGIPLQWGIKSGELPASDQLTVGCPGDAFAYRGWADLLPSEPDRATAGMQESTTDGSKSNMLKWLGARAQRHLDFQKRQVDMLKCLAGDDPEVANHLDSTHARLAEVTKGLGRARRSALRILTAAKRVRETYTTRNAQQIADWGAIRTDMRKA